MEIREIISLFVAVLVLAGIALAIRYGDQTSKVISAGADGFSSIVRAATLQG